MHTDLFHPMQRYWNLAAAAIQAAALDAALERGVLDHLTEPASAAEVAQALSLRPEQMAHLLDMLWSLDLLHRIDGDPVRYRCQPLAQAYFCQGQPGYCADAWRYRRRSLSHFSEQLNELLDLDLSLIHI